MKILFVCTGNTCRSPMAEELFKDLVKKEDLKHITDVSSAGINAIPHQLASLNSIEVMKEKGLDLESHVSKMLTMSLVEEYDIILTMTNAHKENILTAVPDLKGKVFTLKQYVGESGDVCDPFGGSVDVYRNCLRDIESSLNLLIGKLKKEDE